MNKVENSNDKYIGLKFGEAIEAMKAGKKVARAGWNGKGMWLGLVKDTWAINFEVDNDIQKFENHPYIVMKTVDEKIVPWLASQTDMLAEDWTVIE